MRKGRAGQKVVEQYFEVEKILAKRFLRGSAEYLVKWKDFQEAEATWEAANNLASVLDMVLEFERRAEAEAEGEAEGLAEAQQDVTGMQGLPTTTPFFNVPEMQQSEFIRVKVDDYQNEETTEVQGSGCFAEGITFAIDNQAREAFTNMIQTLDDKPTSGRSSRDVGPRVLDNTSVDISYEARQVEARFQKLTEKCETAKMSKKQQKQAKKGRKLEAPPRKRGATPTKPVTEIIVQNQNEDSNKNIFPNQRIACRMQLREKKDTKQTDELTYTARSQKRKNRKTQDLQGQELDCRKENPINNSHSQTPPPHSPHHTPSKDAIELNITQIRMLENIPNKAGEYLVQYDSGSMKILRTVELIVSNPFEFAEYLERKHKVG